MLSEKLRVFVSYSRQDGDFVGELVSGLELAGLDVTIDTRDIAEGEDWQSRLTSMIEQCDTVVFVLSHHSAGSEMCNWEVETASNKGKRIIPLLKEPLGERSPHPLLAQIHYVRFDPLPDGKPRSFMGTLRTLADALKVDVDWLREHTRLQIRAREWEESGRSEHRLMRAGDIAQARQWMERRPPNAPPTTELQNAFIHASGDAETKRASDEQQRLEEIRAAQIEKEAVLQEKEAVVKRLSRRTTLGLAATGGLATASAGLAYWGTSAEQRFTAERRRADETEKTTREYLINKDAMRTDLGGVLRVSSAAPGELALETPDGSSFSKYLTERLTNPDTAFEDAVKDTRALIQDETAFSQNVYVETYLNSRLYLRRRPPNQLRKATIWIGSDYPKSEFQSLPSTLKDGERWQRALEHCTFDIRYRLNPTLSEMREDVEHLEREMANAVETIVPPGDDEIDPATTVSTRGLVRVDNRKSRYNAVSFIVFSGHGFQIDNIDFLACGDTDASSRDGIMSSSLAMTELRSKLDRINGASILVLDACRNNLAFRETR